VYLPSHHEETDLTVLHQAIEAHPLGTWATLGDGELLVNHVPFLLDRTRGPFGTLRAHVARANPVWRELSTSIDSVVAFAGPAAYVTPSWYAAKREHGRVVPTWNYVVVHAHGRPRVIEDRDWLRALVGDLTDRHENGRAQPWRVEDAPANFVEQLCAAIVGIEMPIARLVGKWKVSQNRPEADRRGVAAGLREQGDDASRAMADWIDRTLP
jgi:transcriptional regulator